MADEFELPAAAAGRRLKEVTRSYPELGGTQEHCLMTNIEREPPFLTREMLPWQELENTVLGACFRLGVPGTEEDVLTQMYLDIPLPAPLNRIMLPRIPSRLVQRSAVYDDRGRFLANLLRMHGLLVKANRMALFKELGEPYRWAEAIGDMAVEAAFLIGRLLSRSVLKWKLQPGFHSHALPRAGLETNRLIISEAFARRLFQVHRLELQGVVGNWQALSGFPVYVARFPVFEHGCLPMHLQIEADSGGSFMGINPWVMDQLLLGDFDGDQLYAAFRTDDVKDGTVEALKLPRRPWQNEFGAARAHTGLSTLRLVPFASGPALPWYANRAGENKVQEKAEFPDLATAADRRAAVERADERRFVATFTMVFCWYVPRVLMQTKKYPERQAYALGMKAGEWWSETSFDARKGKSQFKQFDIHGFIELLNQGGKPLPAASLRAQGIPPHALEALEEAWRLSGWDLKRECGISPVFDDLVLKRSRLTGGNPQVEELDHPITEMLRVLKALEVPAGELFQTILDDLDGVEVLGRPPYPTL